ncbi:isopenicillin N synthase family oxygenase [Streptomyces marianii]|nr:isopenicillin N synthase family oxygenase [Streptomyces marianii]
MLTEIPLGPHGDREHIRGALRDGSFLVRSTVPESLLDEAHGFLLAFFALPSEAKADCRVPGGNGQSGYAPPQVATAGKSTTADCGELFRWGSTLPAGHPLRVRFPARYPAPYFPDHLVPGIGSALRELHGRMLRFQHDVARTVGGALGAHPDYFSEILEDGPVVNRAIWHPPSDPVPPAGRARAAEYRDPDLITAQPRATAGGLQVLIDHEWTAVDVPEGYAAVNVGTVLDRLTNGLARAAVQRVVAVPGQREGRLSIAQFCHPAPWATLAPLPVPGRVERPHRFPALTAEELFQRSVYRMSRFDSRYQPLEPPAPFGVAATAGYARRGPRRPGDRI